MSNLALIIYCGLITFLTRFSMIAVLKKEKCLITELGKYCLMCHQPSFPAIIFPGIFINTNGGLDLENNPKILASIIAIIVGIYTKNILATIFLGLAAYWFIIFV